MRIRWIILLYCMALMLACEETSMQMEEADQGSTLMDGLFSQQELTDFFTEITQLGNRPTGSPTHLYTIDWFKNKLIEFGASVNETPYTQTKFFIAEEEENMQARIINPDLDKWTAAQSDKVRLEILNQNNELVAEIPVAHYHQFSGMTDANGVIGDLTVDITDAAGKVFINEYLNTLPDGPSWTDLTQNRRTTINDPDGFFSAPTNQPSAIQKSFSMHSRHQNIENQGAVGMITIYRDLPNEFAEGALMPHIATRKRNTPGIILSASGGLLLDQAIADGGTKAKIILEAAFEEVRINTISTTIEGIKNDENILLNAYIDGQSSTGLPGALALLGIVKKYLSLPQDSIPRNIMFVLTTHFSGSSSAADWAFKNIQTLTEETLVYLGLETVASQSWTSDGVGTELQYAGKNAGCWCYVSAKAGPLLEETTELFINKNQVFPQISVNDNFVFSEGTVFHSFPYNLPVVSCLGPSSVVYNGRTDVINLYDMNLLFQWQLAYDDILNKLLDSPSEELRP